MLTTLFYILFGGLIGATSLWMGIKNHRSRKKVTLWPHTMGKVLDRETSLVAIPRGFHLSIQYTYAVGGKNYHGNRVFDFGSFIIPIGHFNKEFTKQAGWLGVDVDWKKVKTAFPDTIPVRYDPKDPSRSCLLVQPAWHAWVPIVLGIAILSIFSLIALTEIV